MRLAALAAVAGLCCGAAPLKTCPDAPAVKGDRRADKGAVTIASYNLYWLFDGDSDPAAAPWGTPAEATKHAKVMARELDRLQADIFVFVEVEHCSVLDDVIGFMATGSAYRRYLLQGTDYATGQDVALLTKIDPLFTLERTDNRTDYPLPGTACTDTATGSSGVSKHFYAEFELAPSFTIGLVAVHLLAWPDAQARCNQREAQAATIRGMIGEQWAARLASGGVKGVVVLGDYNDYSAEVLDEPGSRPVTRVLDIIKNATTPAMVELSSSVPRVDRYSFGSGGTGELIDHILMTPALADLVSAVGIDHRESASKNQLASDHWCFHATLTLPAATTTTTTGPPSQAPPTQAACPECPAAACASVPPSSSPGAVACPPCGSAGVATGSPASSGGPAAEGAAPCDGGDKAAAPAAGRECAGSLRLWLAVVLVLLAAAAAFAGGVCAGHHLRAKPSFGRQKSFGRQPTFCIDPDPLSPTVVELRSLPSKGQA
ncbi:hypothetical protein DIPPA_28531 [Diplonema papillatum]|nr:hypothetical protein DIPPA_28531 [Diplonema papillatum]